MLYERTDRRLPRFVGFALPALLACWETLRRKLIAQWRDLDQAIAAGEDVADREAQWTADHEQYIDLCADIAMATPRDAAADDMLAVRR